jgi:16S rRNA C967 or C1407 C5-methylase (RsmB/RsmF family)
LAKENIKEVVAVSILFDSEVIIEAIEPLCEVIEKTKKAGLTTMKILAFLEQKLKPEGKWARAKLPLWMEKALEGEAKRERISQAELVRRALTIYLELKPEEREELVQTLRGRWWKLDYLLEHLDEVEEAYKREIARARSQGR